MPALNIKAFVSSTFEDLKDYRTFVIDAVRKAGISVDPMEDWTASAGEPKLLSQDRVEGCDLCVLLVARRRGHVPEGETRSVTELEYAAAVSVGMDVLVWLLDDNALWLRKFDELDTDPQIRIWRDKLCERHVVTFFNHDPASIEVAPALTRWIHGRENPERQEPSHDEESAAPPIADEVTLYRSRARSVHETLPVAGFQTILRVPIRLEDIYVTLHAQLDLRGVGEDQFWDSDQAETQLGARDSIEILLPAAFAESEQRGRRGLVILGDPGSGKTTHLRRMLLWVFEHGSESLGLPSDMLPIFLPLRHLDNLEAGLDAFIETQLRPPHLKMPDGFGRRLLERGRLLFLLDGLDEVADVDDRGKAKAWIEDALMGYPDCRFVLTCRFAGYIPAVRCSERFLELHLRPLDEEQAAAFVRNWYRIVETNLASDRAQAGETAKTAADDLIERLRAPEFRARRVFQLTRNPLLLTNLCLVHRDRGGRLPDRRSRLYRECIDVLLESWRAAKTGLQAPIRADDGRRVLQPAALWLHGKEHRTRATAAELGPVIEPVLRQVRWPGGSANDFLDRIRDESGLLTGWDQEHYGFMHLGFQEFLAASEVWRRHLEGDTSALGELATHHGESWWQEVALLLVAFNSRRSLRPMGVSI